MGDIEMTMSIHPYWSSLRPQGDLYWERVNKLAAERRSVPTVRLDDFADELKLAPPYLLKLDVQGSEVQALRGARNVLANTAVVICEADMADFQAINSELVDAGFDLYDITVLQDSETGRLAGFIRYISTDVSPIEAAPLLERRQQRTGYPATGTTAATILVRLAEVLPQIRAAKAARKSI